MLTTQQFTSVHFSFWKENRERLLQINPMDARSSNIKVNCKTLLGVLFPATAGCSIGEIASIMVLFPEWKKINHLLRMVFLFICYFFFILDGFFMFFIDTHFLPLPRDAVGPLKYGIHIMLGSGFSEVCTTRIYLWYLHWKIGKTNIGWYTMIKDINKHDQPKFFAIAHFIFIELYVNCTVFIILSQICKLLYERSLPIDIIFNLVWIICDIFVVRYSVNDMPFLFIIASSCYSLVKKKFDKFISSLESEDESTICKKQDLSSYKNHFLLRLPVCISLTVQFQSSILLSKL